MRFQNLGTLGLMLLSVAFMGGCEKPTTTTPGGEATPTPQVDQISTTTTVAATPTPSPTPTPADEVDLTVVNWGPKSTPAGVPFNSQGDNQAYMFLTAKKIGTDVVIMFKGQELPERAISLPTNSISARVPAELYKESGDVEVYLLDKATGKKSDTLTFKVEGAKPEAAKPEAAAQQTTQTNEQQPAQANAEQQAPKADEQQAPEAGKKANGKKKTRKKSAE